MFSPPHTFIILSFQPLYQPPRSNISVLTCSALPSHRQGWSQCAGMYVFVGPQHWGCFWPVCTGIQDVLLGGGRENQFGTAKLTLAASWLPSNSHHLCSFYIVLRQLWNHTYPVTQWLHFLSKGCMFKLFLIQQLLAILYRLSAV